MFPLKSFLKKFQAILDELDQLAEKTGDEALEELNAEFEDALFMLSQSDPQDADWDEDLTEALEEFVELAADYEDIPAAEGPTKRLRMLLELASRNTQEVKEQ